MGPGHTRTESPVYWKNLYFPNFLFLVEFHYHNMIRNIRIHATESVFKPGLTSECCPWISLLPQHHVTGFATKANGLSALLVKLNLDKMHQSAVNKQKRPIISSPQKVPTTWTHLTKLVTQLINVNVVSVSTH